MNFIITLLLMYFSLFGVNIQDPTPIYSIEEGINEIRTVFPDWHDNYDFGEFDCTEMSMFVTNYFKIHGFNAELHHGKYKSKGHAWVTVNGIIVECTSLTIKENTEHYIESKNIKIYPTLKEIDWWNSQYIQGKFGDNFTQQLFNEIEFNERYKKDNFIWENMK